MSAPMYTGNMIQNVNASRKMLITCISCCSGQMIDSACPDQDVSPKFWNYLRCIDSC